MPMSELTGRCFCGAVRYRCGAPLFPATLCHCQSCRRVAGAPSVGWLTVSAETLVYTAGEPTEYSSSPSVLRSFCSACGTPLTWRSAKHHGEIDVTLATLDRPDMVAPADHVWMEHALPWDRPNDGLPQHQRERVRK